MNIWGWSPFFNFEGNFSPNLDWWLGKILPNIRCLSLTFHNSIFYNLSSSFPLFVLPANYLYWKTIDIVVYPLNFSDHWKIWLFLLIALAMSYFLLLFFCWIMNDFAYDDQF